MTACGVSDAAVLSSMSMSRATGLDSKAPSFRPSAQSSKRRPVWLLMQVVGPPGGGTRAKGPVTRDSLTGSPHRPAPSVSEDLQQKVYYSCLYPPVGIKDWSIWMWATISSLTCQNWLREFISELCLPPLFLNCIFFEVLSNPIQIKSSNFFDANHGGCPLLIYVCFKHINVTAASLLFLTAIDVVVLSHYQ